MNMTDILTGLREAVSGGGVVSIVLALGVLLVVLLLGAGISYVAYLFSPRGKLEMLVHDKEVKHRNPWPLRLAVVAVLLLVPAVFQAGVHTRPACTPCHDKPAKQISKSPHATASCAGCHGATGVTAPVANGISLARWGWSYGIMGDRATGDERVIVESRNCLSCHPNVSTRTSVKNGIRISHKEFLGSSLSCLDCHGDVGHATKKDASGPKMNQCLPCHDGKRASSDCSTCHVRDLAAAAVARKGTKPSVKITDMSCYGSCHSGNSCTRCHGATMPHPEGWSPVTRKEDNVFSPGQHARAGFVNRDVCYRCHFRKGEPFKPADEGCACHGQLGRMHGGKPWVKEHGLQATGKKTGELAECFMCHSSDLCSYCHPASYQQLYAPRPGPDDYRRETQRTPRQEKIVGGL